MNQYNHVNIFAIVLNGVFISYCCNEGDTCNIFDPADITISLSPAIEQTLLRCSPSLTTIGVAGKSENTSARTLHPSTLVRVLFPTKNSFPAKVYS